MIHAPPRRAPRVLLGALAAFAFITLLLPSLASAGRGEDRALAKKAFFDIRQSPGSLRELHARIKPLPAAAAKLKQSLGVEGVVSIDPLTSTARMVGRTDGFLTGPSSASASGIALGYASSNAAALGLTPAALASLRLVRDYVSIDGTHHLFYLQKIHGIAVFGNGLKANVTKDGRLVNVLGSPIADLTPATTSAAITAGQAVAAAKRDVGFSLVPLRGESAQKVYFRTVGGNRLAYQTIVSSGSEMYLTVVDAQSGRILYRRSLVNYAGAQVLDNYPNAPLGGTPHAVSLDQWLSPGATTLTGPNVHVYSDVNDSDTAQASEETTEDATGNFNYAFNSFNGPACVKTVPCSWSPQKAFSWDTNRNQSATQLFYFINKFHDHLAAAPIGFTAAAGNFEGNDPVHGENLDGANTAGGLPDGGHIDNANFATPPDGQSGRMQMFLWHQPGTKFPSEDPFIAANGSDEADIVYHENTHGLSNRLVVDASGNSTLGGVEAGAMGEAWSDWYAMDFLVDQGFEVDTSAPGELRIGNYVGWGNNLIRFQPIDCPVGASASACPGGRTTGSGGFTYGDYGHVGGGPEVHDDGEIWGETLWDLRSAVGSPVAEGLITRAMELSPANPSFLDMRNAILQADMVDFGGSHHSTIWSVFAHRGMGYFAAAVDGDDSQPAESFSLPPAAGTPQGKLIGSVTDQDTGKAIAGAQVGFGGHVSGFAEDLVGTTNNGGAYQVNDIFYGRYPKVFARSPGYDRIVLPSVTIGTPVTMHDFQLRRDWASLAGGGTINAFNGPDYTDFGCGPTGAIDQSLGNGWGSDTDANAANTGNVTPKFVVVKLPVAVNVAEIAIDPSNTCGDPGSSSTHHYTVETSPNGTTWTLANEGRFYLANRGHLNSVPLAAGSTSNVRYVRFTMINPQVPDTGNACIDASNCSDTGVALRCGPNPPVPGNFGGCTFMDMSEIEVYGRPA